MDYFVYAIYSTKHDRIYVGMSMNPKNRLLSHNAGEVASTQFYRPWHIVYSELVGDRKSARVREKELKSGSGKEFLKRLVYENIPR